MKLDLTQFLCCGRYYLELTCGACPEQYDVYNESGRKVSYLRLRHGYFRCDVPDVFGTTIYDSNPEGNGAFTDEERPIELQNAVDSIDKFYDTHNIDEVWAEYTKLNEKPNERPT